MPNITVCPPKNSYLNLNYDIIKSKEVLIDNDTRQEFLEYAIEVAQDALHAEIMKNLSILEDPDRFNNWYRGYNRISYPYFMEGRLQFNRKVDGGASTYTYDNQLIYGILSSALSGNISTKYFGENLDEKKVERDIFFRISVYPPKSVKGDEKAAMILQIKKISVQNDDKLPEMKLNGLHGLSNSITDWSLNITSYPYMILEKNDGNFNLEVSLYRKLSKHDILNTKQKKMPGFSFSWRYNINVEEPWAKFRKTLISKYFVRYLYVFLCLNSTKSTIGQVC